jgi:RNA polymerase sigma-70 factor, ECF subfamily
MATTRASPARAAVDNSFEELYRGHHGDVYRVVLREVGNVHDAEDVTQAAFLDAYRAVLRGTQPQSPRAWLIAIAENVRRRRYRTSQRRPREEPLDADFPLAAELSHELAQTLAEALAELPHEQRRVFLLREFTGLSYDEIAERVDGTVASVQMLLFRARRALREQLEPPTVAPRRTGLLVPLPGWLAGLVSRFEVAGVTPRIAGAVGATVLTVAGASVAVSESRADPPSRPVVPAASSASAPGARDLSASLETAIPMARPTPTRAAPERRPAVPARRPARPQANAAVPTSSPAGAQPTPAQAVDLPSATASVLPALERPSLRLPLQKPEVQGLLELPVPPPSSVGSVDETTGAAGAAGAGAPPLPVPSLPPVPLPPA